MQNFRITFCFLTLTTLAASVSDAFAAEPLLTLPAGANMLLQKRNSENPPVPATYVESKREGWMLFDATAEPLTEASDELPKEYAAWDFETQEWPGRAAGVLVGTPVFRLADGTLVSGKEYIGDFADPELKKEFLAKFSTRLKVLVEKLAKAKTDAIKKGEHL